MLATGRNLSLVFALVALTLFVIMVSRNTVASPVNIDATRLYGEESGSSPTQAHRQIRDTRFMNYDDIIYNYDDYITFGGTSNSSDDGMTPDDDFGGAPGEKIVQGNCHIGTLLYQQNLNLDVYRSSSVETDLQVSLDESYCIACVRVHLRKKMKSTVSIGTINATRGGPNTVKLMITGSQYEYSEHVRLNYEVFVVRKRGRRCNSI